VNRLLYSSATLVVCAVSLVGQWADEAAQRTNGSLRILQYHGQGRYKYTAKKLASDYDGEAFDFV
jgi:SNF2 family DNA or RNA helicase